MGLTAQEISDKHNATLPPKEHNSKGQLKAYVDRFNNLADRADEVREDTKELAAEAKGNGFDVAAIKKIVKLAREDADKKSKRENAEAVFDTYAASLGLFL